ncbi:tRNA (adenosine(37)-N6)-threonylcarbamoyltransferase complex dimerization subunit type 1 TsaB [Nakamurella flavida]|uniref:tRNA (Adenosine(37)-N6)-threonylcarbamoyltransferase complex dimerization subunit type 1 TsaB n=1 Tax=Nakamurella flavida TaxID=363630 RepID=A0A938YSJ4_9ACTN|nr:tRNA (adenosine(37)-N6)-threonylcarbamoyltransferase complex dimerization subunit type 1 TsaB [Nakamurella flavida]MBM9475907.1 tRNA (adenosine(37)-N6)-threonylcarbamoyltransferase complex dimerization subunit type 1 TsaB [Nakamurella flavida]MBM9478433.1 tRNA (adenosine(37)-N6)-threonylcarbamoyltransferase complex dimerization subunit type 1 TsaB [Nakamurella flavida]MDP9777807.1 tRNA threonylcarbamoyl adenosine modification protein YeaZ [Nakamurella flavida]
MLVLALDTSTPLVTAGVVRLSPGQGAVLLAEHSVDNAFAHAERLMPLVRAALTEAGAGLPDLDAVVVGLGPGPFTGLRVGIATAAALGDGLDIAVHGVPSHDGTAAAARAAGWSGGGLLVATDARRREVYASAFDASGVRTGGPAVLAPAAVTDWLAERGAVTGVTGAGAALVDLDLPVVPTPTGVTAGLVAVAADDLLSGATPGPLTPLYLRRPDATEPGLRKSVLGR